MIAEHMAAALFAGHRDSRAIATGRWRAARAAAPAWRTSPRAEPLLVASRSSSSTSRRRGRAPSPATGSRRSPSSWCATAATTVFETLINPERPIPPFVTALTNITWEMVRDAPRFADVCDQLLGVLEGHVFVAHNAGFDWRFITAEVARARGRELTGRRLCTVRLARRLVPRLRRRYLDWVAGYYG